MASPSNWYRDPRLWLETFTLVNHPFLDIWLAHSVNAFSHEAEYILFYAGRPPMLLVAAL